MKAEHFDRWAYNDEVSNYKQAVEKINSIISDLNLIGFDFKNHTLEQVALKQFDELHQQYVESQAQGVKNPTLKEMVADRASDLFWRYLNKYNVDESNSLWRITQLDFTLLKFERGKPVMFIGEKQLREKHTYKPKTENQKQAFELVQNILEKQAQLITLIGDVPVVGYDGCFFLENERLEYNEQMLRNI